MKKKKLIGKRVKIKPGDYNHFMIKDYVKCEGTIIADYRDAPESDLVKIRFDLCVKMDRDDRYISVKKDWIEIL